jgi:2-(1,2-epoxy-1,2-dihydrophenyl)acetyl-CoA isomerase
MPALLTDLSDGVQTITLNQPDKFNALSRAMIKDLADVVRTVERDDAIRAVVITGAGKAFSSGADISEFDTSNGGMDAGDVLRRVYNPLVTRLHALEKPVLAAVNGVAAGAGMSLALTCDLRYAAESARFVVAFIKIGLVPDAGFSYFLPRLIGPAKTLELAWTADPLEAQEAYELGMLNKVLPDDQLLGHVQEVAARLARAPAKPVGLIKRAVNKAHELPLDRVLELEANYQTVASRDPNFAEGVAAFREKRQPNFRR